MVKKIKQRPRRLFYNDKTDRYFYLINGKKKYIKKPTKTITSKEISRINIRNIIPVPVKVKTIRPKGSIRPITNERIVSKVIPVPQTLIPSIYTTGMDFEKRISKLEEKFKPEDKKPEPKLKIDTESTDKNKTTFNPLKYFKNITKPKVKAPKPSTPEWIIEERKNQEKNLTPKSKSFFSFFTGKKSDESEGESKPLPPPPPTQPKLKNMTTKQYQASYNKFKSKYKGDIGLETYDKFLEFQSKDNVYSKYNPVDYDMWLRTPDILPELQITPPEDKETLKEKARESRLKYFIPEKEGSNIQIFNQGRNEEEKDEISNLNIVPNEKITGKGEYEDDDDGIYNDELQQIFEDKTNKFLPVIASDKMDTLLPFVNKDTKKFGWIQNTEPSGSSGRHWVAYFIDIPNYEVNYYDSLVENDGEPPVESLKGLKKIIDKIHPDYYLLFKYNTIRDQNPLSKNCGYFSLKFILDRYRNIPFKTATSYDSIYNYNSDDDEAIDNYGAGEKMIKKFKKYL